MTTSTPATISANIIKAIAVLEAIPESRFDLHTFKQETSCGTIACAAGWLCADPHFADLGMTLSPSSRDTFHSFRLHQAGTPSDSCEFAFLDNIFGADAFDRLFDERGAGVNDDFIVDENGDDFDLTDKGLAIARMRLQLKQYQAT